jgi:hypothetical protein
VAETLDGGGVTAVWQRAIVGPVISLTDVPPHATESAASAVANPKDKVIRFMTPHQSARFRPTASSGPLAGRDMGIYNLSEQEGCAASTSWKIIHHALRVTDF